MSRITTLALSTVLLMIVAGCGPAQKQPQGRVSVDDVPDDIDLAAELTGVHDVDPNAIEEDTEEKPVASGDEGDTNDENNIGGNMSALIVKVLVNGKPVEAKVVVRRASQANDVVRDNLPVNEQVEMDPGLYDIVVRCAQVAGNPEFTLRDVDLPPGRRIVKDVKIPVGQLTLKTGERCTRKPIRIRPKGASDWYPGKFSTCEPILLMAGEYEAEMGAGKGGVPVSGIQVYDGGILERLIRAQ